MIKIDKEEKIKEIIRFLKNNPQTTYRELGKAGYNHLERLFSGGLKEAYTRAEIKFPRTFEKKSKQQRRKIIIDYIKKNPKVGGQIIVKNTKINIGNTFKNTKEAFEAAGVPYLQNQLCKLRSMNKQEKRNKILKLLIANPESTFEEIRNKTEINPYKIFKNLKEAYNAAGIKEINRHEKRSIRKRKKIIEFIKNNSLATQREINKNCKTRIQSLFKRGIFEAYENAQVKFPFERLNLHGSAISEVKQRAENFEEEIAKKLSRYGLVNRLVKTKRGIADIILERKNEKIIIEVKDYLNKEISKHEIKQLNKYLEDMNVNKGFIICHTKPKRHRFLIGKNKIWIIAYSEMNTILELMDRG